MRPLDCRAAPLLPFAARVHLTLHPSLSLLCQTVIHTRDAVIAFGEHRMERRSIYTGKITHQMKDKGERFRVVGREGNIIIETRAEGESTSHLYLLLRK